MLIPVADKADPQRQRLLRLRKAQDGSISEEALEEVLFVPLRPKE